MVYFSKNKNATEAGTRSYLDKDHTTEISHFLQEMLLTNAINWFQYIFIMSQLLCFSPLIKKLINKFDFEALDVKMEKCKVSHDFEEAKII